MVYVGDASYGYIYALDANTGNVVWQFRTGYYVESSPAVVNGMVYVGSMDYNLYALNASTGAVIWSYSVGPINCRRLTAACGPAVANGVVYTQSILGVYAVNASTGALIWTKFIEGNTGPSVANGVLYFGSAYSFPYIFALDASTGTQLWRYTTGAEVDSSQTIVNGILYSGSTDGNVYAFHLPGH